MMKNGVIAEYNDSYGARLMEQGKAVLAPETPAKEEADAETPAKGKRGSK